MAKSISRPGRYIYVALPAMLAIAARSARGKPCGARPSGGVPPETPKVSGTHCADKRAWIDAYMPRPPSGPGWPFGLVGLRCQGASAWSVVWGGRGVAPGRCQGSAYLTAGSCPLGTLTAGQPPRWYPLAFLRGASRPCSRAYEALADGAPQGRGAGRARVGFGLGAGQSGSRPPVGLAGCGRFVGFPMGPRAARLARSLAAGIAMKLARHLPDAQHRPNEGAISQPRWSCNPPQRRMGEERCAGWSRLAHSSSGPLVTTIEDRGSHTQVRAP